MAHVSRHDEILKVLTILRFISVQELSKRLAVSEVTIRKDLSFLEKTGKIVRTHGGAQLTEETVTVTTFEMRVQQNSTVKQLIAKRACQMIKEGDTIYLDAGSTCLAVAQEIKKMHLRVITNSMDCMAILCTHRNITLFSLGGEFLPRSRAFWGNLPQQALENIHINTCFIGAAGFTSDGLFSSQNPIEANLKQRVLRSSARRIALVDSSKFEKPSFSIFARSTDVDVLITDAQFKPVQLAQDVGITLIVVGISNETSGC
jgi:DeoR/GlpR family transcriptional regulator of sugar metabolism